MSHLKKIMDSANLKEKYSTLLESLDRTNTSKMIIERQYGELCSLEIAEGTSTAIDVQDELKGIGVEVVPHQMANHYTIFFHAASKPFDILECNRNLSKVFCPLQQRLCGGDKAADVIPRASFPLLALFVAVELVRNIVSVLCLDDSK